MNKMKDTKNDLLDDIVTKVDRTALSAFARLNAGVSMVGGESAYPSSRDFCERVLSYLTPQGELNDEGVAYVTEKVRGNRILKDNYQHFLRGLAEEALKRYE